MARLPILKDHISEIESLPLAKALSEASKYVAIEREGAASESAISAAEAALGVTFPADYRAFLRDAGGMKVVGDAAYGFGYLYAFGLGELAARREELFTRFPDCEPKIVPLLLDGDEIEQGTVGVGLDGNMYWVHAKGGESHEAASFEEALVEDLGKVIIVDPDKRAGRTPRFVVATFATTDDADALLERFDEADAGEGDLDFVSQADETKLEILPIAGGKQVLIAHMAPYKFDEARAATVCREAGASSVLTTTSAMLVTIRSTTNRGFGSLVQAFDALAREVSSKLVEHDTSSEVLQKKSLAACHSVLKLDSKTTSGLRAIGLRSGQEAGWELITAMLTLLRNKESKDCEIHVEEPAATRLA